MLLVIKEHSFSRLLFQAQNTNWKPHVITTTLYEAYYIYPTVKCLDMKLFTANSLLELFLSLVAIHLLSVSDVDPEYHMPRLTSVQVSALMNNGHLVVFKCHLYML